MKLLLVRHAVAEPRVEEGGTQPDDALRALTARGRRRMEEIARALAWLSDPPDVLASSPLVRATETAAILADAFEGVTPVSVPELEPGAGPEAVVKWLRHLPADHTVAAVGHEPDLSITASWLIAGRKDPVLTFKKGGACLIDLEDGVGQGAATLRWLLTPKQLRALRD
jgi:phosphohistidine phosphatase